MQQTINLRVSPAKAAETKRYVLFAAKQLHIDPKRIKHIRILKKSVDARTPRIKINLRLLLFIDETAATNPLPRFEFASVADKPRILIIGTGPAGLFAALRLIELGLKPVLLERGQSIRARKRDIAMLNRNKGINAESNYSFGEGGAGTFSDGKLYTRSTKRGNTQRILELFHFFGAPETILYAAHPHIGTDKLPRVIKAIRNQILQSGGEVHFNTRVNDLIIENNTVKGVKTADEKTFFGESLILATGHSARDVYRMLHRKGISMQAKDFAVGVRVEHSQRLINDIQYHCSPDAVHLPSASYSLVKQINGRGVYSFCMCPGGFIVPAATDEEQIVVNGMSPSHRNSRYANSGMVAEVKPADLDAFGYKGVLAGLEFQEDLEHKAFLHADQTLRAPAQRLIDFIQGKPSATLPASSYLPGMVASPLHEWLPGFVSKSLRKAFILFGKRMKGYLTNEAVVLGVETRTSAPLTIPRKPDTLEHITTQNLFPCGEGAGYAGGIVSSAIDGERCAEQIAKKLLG